MQRRTSRRGILAAVPLGTLLLAGCSLQLDVHGNLALTNSYGELTDVAVRITDRESDDRLLVESYRVPASDDGLLVEDVVTAHGSYDVEATIESTDDSASAVWRLSPDDGEGYQGNYSIRIAILSDGSLGISGDGI